MNASPRYVSQKHSSFRPLLYNWKFKPSMWCWCRMRLIAQFCIVGMLVSISPQRIAAIEVVWWVGWVPPGRISRRIRSYPIWRCPNPWESCGETCIRLVIKSVFGGGPACCVISSFMPCTMRLAVDIELNSKKARLGQNPIIPHEFGKHIS